MSDRDKQTKALWAINATLEYNNELLIHQISEVAIALKAILRELSLRD